MTSPADMRDHALAWAARGFRVFPLWPGTKRPAASGWRESATTSAQIITKVWSREAFNIGVLCNDMIVVDCDVKNGRAGLASYFELGLPMDTLTVQTPSGGVHYYLSGPSTRNRVMMANGLDVRSFNGYVVAPGSVLPGIGAYSVLTEGLVLPAPESFIAEVGAPRERVRRDLGIELDTDTNKKIAIEYLATAPLAVKGAGGDACTYAVACNLRDLGISEDLAVELLLDHWNDRTTPGWSDERLRIKVENAFSYALNSAGSSSPEAMFAGVVVDPVEYKPGIEPARLKPRAALQISATPFSWPDPARILRRQWLFGRWILPGEVTTIFSPGGAGKSTLSTTIAISLASGRDLLGQQPRGQLGAWIYNLEDAPDELERQVSAACLWHGIKREDCGDRLHVNSGITMPLCTATENRDGFEINEAAFAQLTETIKHHGISVVIVDPLISSHRVSESKNEAIDAIAKRWKRLAHETGCAVVLVHHTRKLNGKDATAEDGRGAIALRDAARVVLVLNKVGALEAGNLGITDPQIWRSLVKVDIGKASRSPDVDSIWFKLESQSLDNGDEGGPSDLVGVATKFERPDVFAGLTDYHLWQVQQRLAERDWKASACATDWVGYLVADVAGIDPKAGSGKIKAILKKWNLAGWLVVERRADANSVERPCVGIGKPVNRPEIGSPHFEKPSGESGESEEE